MKTKTTPILKPASIGSISHGTLRTEDLLSSFLSELESLALLSGDFLSLPENHAQRDYFSNLVGEAQDCFSEIATGIDPDKEDEALELVNEALPDALQQFAPPYCYFGTHEGDGSDFGFWPSCEAINDLPCIAENTQEAIDAEQSENYSTDVRYVNDHGNVTVYSPAGAVVIELV